MDAYNGGHKGEADVSVGTADACRANVQENDYHAIDLSSPAVTAMQAEDPISSLVASIHPVVHHVHTK